MSQRGWLLLALVTLVTIVGLILGSDPEQAGRLAQMRRDAAFTGETREMVLFLLAFGIGGFIIYLTMTRR